MTATATTLTWTAQQETALRRIRDWRRDGAGDPFYLGGFAGTGKTTLIRELAEPGVIYAAFTNKAVRVLQRKGIGPASTLHSLLYTPVEIEHENEDGSTRHELRWEATPRDALLEAKLLIIDEASMVNGPILRDIQDVVPSLPILAVGDPMQLPPVEGRPAFDRPDFMLTDIVRQARENPIIHLSMIVRDGGVVAPGSYGGKVAKIRAGIRDVIGGYLETLERADQVLCGTHKVRRRIIRLLRDKAGRTSTYPQRDDRIMVLNNDRDNGLFNGMEVVARADTDVELMKMNSAEFFPLDVVDETGLERRITFDVEAFENEKPSSYNVKAGRALGDFANAITVHKSQGSEWDKVAIVDDWNWPDAPHRDRWLYTAITRAADRLVIFGR